MTVVELEQWEWFIMRNGFVLALCLFAAYVGYTVGSELKGRWARATCPCGNPALRGHHDTTRCDFADN